MPIAAGRHLRAGAMALTQAQIFGPHRIWQMLFWRRRSSVKPCASMVKHPVKSDFHTVVTKVGVSVTFKPTNSMYSFDRLADNDASFVGVQHAGRNTGDYPSNEVQHMAQQIALEYPAIHFCQFPVET